MSSIFGGPLVSFELMPPRNPDNAPKFWGTVKRLMDFRPDFVSVTYGAGGRNADTAHEVIAQLVRHTPVQPIAHFTCVGMSRAGVYEELAKYLRTGVRTFLALRGDPPVGDPDWSPAPDSLQSAVELVAAIHANGGQAVLVSGGFTFFADRVKASLGIDFARSNRLEVEDGLLTGRMVDQPWGDICDGAEKRRTLLEMASLMGIDPSQAIAVGDGANDLPMMGAAGLSVAYHAKPAVRAQANIAINQGGLDRLLEVLRP